MGWHDGIIESFRMGHLMGVRNNPRSDAWQRCQLGKQASIEIIQDLRRG